MSVFGGDSIAVGKLRVDVLTLRDALAVVARLVDEKVGGSVFTPNVDHVMLCEEDARFREAYGRATLSLADGFPIVAVSKFMEHRLPEKISGSDFVGPLLAQCADRGHTVYFFGGNPGVAEKAAAKLLEKHPTLKVVGMSAPMVSPTMSDSELNAVLAPIEALRPDVILVCLGAPKQELFIDRVAERLRPAVLLGLGASLDFIAGTTKRAPAWMSENGLEWLYRLSQDRGRLWRRYLLRDARFPAVLFRQFVLERRRS